MSEVQQKNALGGVELVVQKWLVGIFINRCIGYESIDGLGAFV